MRLEELDFDLPPDAIAQRPVEPRDSCRLIYLPSNGRCEHLRFFDLPTLLHEGDTLVLNDSRVLPARVSARKSTGGVVELLFLRPVPHSDATEGECWEALVRPPHRLRPRTQLRLAGGELLGLTEEFGQGRWLVCGPPGLSMIELMQTHGRLPLPPYIKGYHGQPSDYQTVYAAAPGSAAAPTAGLHFTNSLLERLRGRGIDIARVTLHVGLDTFLPIRESVVERHQIHRETFEASAATVTKLKDARSTGRRLVAVGTTAARVLETLAQRGALAQTGESGDVSGSTDIFITPGYRFLAVDTLLTNLHVPRSTVLALTMAFAGAERLRESYREALACGYRFFSFGDAMLIEKAIPQHAGAGVTDA